MKTLISLFALLLLPNLAYGQHAMTQTKPPTITLMPGLGHLHHAVSTSNPEAQRYFDQGLTLVYAFHHEAAVRSFQHAAELDPQLAMAYWGVALALGPNINLDIDADREKQAAEAIQKAQALAANASEPERAYIAALAKRYSSDPKANLPQLAIDYKNAMGDLVKRTPDDLDAATLYAESLMDLRPWKLWTSDGKPAEGTEEIVSVLQSVLRRDPNHIGANHYYIHAVEASPHPERALACAKRLESLVPGAGHLVHMLAHIYIRVGDYDAAARANERAVAVDRAYLEHSGFNGIYPMYYLHNLDFLQISYGMEGRYQDARRTVDQFAANAGPMVKQMPAMFEYAMAKPLLVLKRFRRWDDILQMPAPDVSLPVTNAIWRYERGLAYAAQGRVSDAEEAQKAFLATEKQVSADAAWGLNPAGSVLAIAENVLGARIAWARMDKQAGIDLLRKAVEAEDALSYDEPPDWYPVRETLGGTLLRAGDYAGAEQVFRADLVHNPHNPRSLRPGGEFEASGQKR